jgi:hypothetical protein
VLISPLDGEKKNVFGFKPISFGLEVQKVKRKRFLRKTELFEWVCSQN